MSSFVSTNPRTGETEGSYPVSNEQDVYFAVQRSKDIQEDWGSDLDARLNKLEHFQTYFILEADNIAKTVCEEIGKPAQEAYGAEILPVCKAISWLLKTGRRHLKPKRLHNLRNIYEIPVPLGVVGIIGTWNYPILLDLIPMLWALIAGNTVVWKPSPLATKCAKVIINLLQKANLPVQMITGDASTGEQLCRASIDKLAFTGSAATGRAIMRELALNGTPCVMELSGNDAMIVCDDADIEEASSAAVWARCSNAGQSCVAPQRIYVASSVADKFVKACERKIRSLRPGTDYGPLRSETFALRMDEILTEAVQQGACFASDCKCEESTKGFWRNPALLTNCTETMRVMQEDLFAPVVAVSTFQDNAKVVDFINKSSLALSATIWTTDLAKGKAIASRLHVGMVGINQEAQLIAADCRIPFGGMRGSGFGTVHGVRGLDEWVKWKVISFQRAGRMSRHRFPYTQLTVPILSALVKCTSRKRTCDSLAAAVALLKAVKDWRQPEQLE